MPGTLALVVEHAHRRACAPQAAAVVVRTVVPVRRSRRRIRSAGSCSTAEHCRYHAAALGELPPAQRWPRRARSAREQRTEWRREWIGWQMADETQARRGAKGERREAAQPTTQLGCIMLGSVLGSVLIGIDALYPLTG